MYKVGDEVSVKGEITKVCESGVVVKAHYFGEAYFDRSNMDLIGKTYEEGLSDAWELAKKIVCAKGFNMDELGAIFGKRTSDGVLENFTVEEALAKIEAYEKEKAEIKVGDVVNNGNLNGVVTNVGIECVYVTYEDGVNGWAKKSYCAKTGKHIDIESLLRQIGE